MPDITTISASGACSLIRRMTSNPDSEPSPRSTSATSKVPVAERGLRFGERRGSDRPVAAQVRRIGEHPHDGPVVVDDEQRNRMCVHGPQPARPCADTAAGRTSRKTRARSAGRQGRRRISRRTQRLTDESQSARNGCRGGRVSGMQQTGVSGMERHSQLPKANSQLPKGLGVSRDEFHLVVRRTAAWELGVGFLGVDCGEVPGYSPIPYFFISRHIVVRLTCSSRAAAVISPPWRASVATIISRSARSRAAATVRSGGGIARGRATTSSGRSSGSSCGPRAIATARWMMCSS